MPYRKGHFARGEIYHLYNRGVDGNPIFATPENYHYLLRKVQSLRDEQAIAILAYCLMPNHYHFVLRQEGEVPLSSFAQRLFQTYTQAYNRQQGRRGPLFEGRFQHAHVDHDACAIHLCRDVHLNPVAAGLVARPGDWPYSNYRAWTGTLLDAAFVESYFQTPDAYVAFVEGDVDPAMAARVQPYLLDGS